MVIEFLRDLWNSSIVSEILTIIAIFLIYLGVKYVFKLLKKHNIDASAFKPIIIQIAEKISKKVIDRHNSKHKGMEDINSDIKEAAKDTILGEEIKTEDKKESK